MDTIGDVEATCRRDAQNPGTRRDGEERPGCRGLGGRRLLMGVGFLLGVRDVRALRVLTAARPWEHTETTGAGVTWQGDIVAQEADAFKGGETSPGRDAARRPALGAGPGSGDEGEGARAGAASELPAPGREHARVPSASHTVLAGPGPGLVGGWSARLPASSPRRAASLLPCLHPAAST